MTISFQRVGLSPDFVDYGRAWDLQRELHDDVASGRRGPTVLLLEHSPVYTAGKRTEPADLPLDGTPVVDVDRGGKLTWHGPGQLVAYPIVELKDHAAIRDYVERLEQVLVNVLADYGVAGTRIRGRAGVWIEPEQGPARKIGAIGIRVDHGVTMHGFALNCSHSLDPYRQIIPCGITDAGITTLSLETGRTIEPAELLQRVEEEFTTVLLPAVKSAEIREGALS
ncbi:lipoyl(octanoyl) transferase LipB [Zafaria sp. Z1313]|uniref:lipoyl(octanoyl) transferase LipB n=1 Tax=unclassified Zafaria TaxID=2828765 RepID=UPI002E79DADA|nr:lipoyl(octanoyl) transferase LipB [Zafaria sp. J156]MEE1620262.1 lipoyl(octanoyl) transferase LipB [Zafaria sp. J156]